MVPKLRFKEFCGEWEEKKLENIADILSGKRIPKGMHLSIIDTGIKYITVSDMGDKYINIENIKYISEEIEKKIKKYKVSENDIIISVAGTLGKINIVTKDFQNANLTENCDKITNLKGVNYKYLYMYLNSSYIQDQINSIYTVSSQPKLALTRIRNFVIKVPSLPEQTKTADFLSTVDDKIQNQQDKITHLENIKKGFMQKILSRKIRFKDDGGEEFSDWEENILKDYIEIITGYPFDSEKFIEENNNNPIIRIRDLQDNKISLFTTENYDLKYKVYKGDILIGMDGDFYITMWKDIEVGLNQRIMKIKPKIGLIKNNFLYYLLIPLVKHINDITPFTTVKHLSSKDILNLKVNLPCLKEQQKIEDFLSSFDEKISTEKETLEHLKQIKKGLLQQMFI